MTLYKSYFVFIQKVKVKLKSSNNSKYVKTNFPLSSFGFHLFDLLTISLSCDVLLKY